MGAGWGSALRHVIVPLSLPGILAGNVWSSRSPSSFIAGSHRRAQMPVLAAGVSFAIAQRLAARRRAGGGAVAVVALMLLPYALSARAGA